MSHLKSVAWLHNHLNEEHVRVIDCRFTLGEPDNGQGRFLKEHIPGALYFDLERDLSGAVAVHGGRHPLPSSSIFRKVWLKPELITM